MMYLILLACLESTPSKSNAVSTPQHTSQTQDLVQHLSTRDHNLSCNSLSSAHLQKDLTKIVDTIHLPPWVPMRATACLTELFPEESHTDLARWISDPEKKGLAFLIAGKLSKLPDASAITIAKAGLNGPHGRDIRIRIKKQNDARLTPLLSSP